MFRLVHVVGGPFEFPRLLSLDAMFEDVANPLGSEDMIRDIDGTTILLTAGGEALDPIGVFVDDAHMIEDVPVFGGGPDLTSTQANAFQWRDVFHGPGHLVEAVHVLFHVEVSRQPSEVEPVADLPLHVGPFGFTRVHPQSLSIVCHLNGDDLPHAVIVDLVKGGSHAVVVPPAQSGDERGFFLARRQVSRTERTPGASTATGFSAKMCFPFSDSVFEMSRAEVWRRAEQHDIDTAVDHFLISIEACELMVWFDGDPVGDVLNFLELIEAPRDAIGESVPHGDQLGIRGCRSMLEKRHRSLSSTAADETNFQDVTPGSKQRGVHGQRGNSRPSQREGTPVFRKVRRDGMAICGVSDMAEVSRNTMEKGNAVKLCVN